MVGTPSEAIYVGAAELGRSHSHQNQSLEGQADAGLARQPGVDLASGWPRNDPGQRRVRTLVGSRPERHLNHADGQLGGRLKTPGLCR